MHILIVNILLFMLGTGFILSMQAKADVLQIVERPKVLLGSVLSIREIATSLSKANNRTEIRIADGETVIVDTPMDRLKLNIGDKIEIQVSDVHLHSNDPWTAWKIVRVDAQLKQTVLFDSNN